MQSQLILGLTLTLAVGGACRSTQDPKSAAEGGTEAPEPYVRVVPDEPAPIGQFLAELDQDIGLWTKLTLTARNDKERRKTTILQAALQDSASRRTDELIEQLEGGPRQNRIRAAGALGFTGSPAAQSPLLAALHDDSPDVICNALLGLTLLEMPDTPLDSIVSLFESSPDAQIRANAGYAIRSILEAGGQPSPQVARATQLGLIDNDPFVRTHSALIAGLIGNLESLGALRDLLGDEAELVSLSAARALLLITKAHPKAKPQVAMALAQAMQNAKRPQRNSLRRALVELSGQNLGEKPDAWIAWAKEL
jgi:hypothetical protein